MTAVMNIEALAPAIKPATGADPWEAALSEWEAAKLAHPGLLSVFSPALKRQGETVERIARFDADMLPILMRLLKAPAPDLAAVTTKLRAAGRFFYDPKDLRPYITAFVELSYIERDLDNVARGQYGSARAWGDRWARHASRCFAEASARSERDRFGERTGVLQIVPECARSWAGFHGMRIKCYVEKPEFFRKAAGDEWVERARKALDARRALRPTAGDKKTYRRLDRHWEVIGADLADARRRLFMASPPGVAQIAQKVAVLLADMGIHEPKEAAVRKRVKAAGYNEELALLHVYEDLRRLARRPEVPGPSWEEMIAALESAVGERGRLLGEAGADAAMTPAEFAETIQNLWDDQQRSAVRRAVTA